MSAGRLLARLVQVAVLLVRLALGVLTIIGDRRRGF